MTVHEDANNWRKQFDYRKNTVGGGAPRYRGNIPNPVGVNTTKRTDAQIANTKRLQAKGAERWGDGSDEQDRAYLDSVWANKVDSGGSGSRMKVDSKGNWTGDYEVFGPNPPGGGGYPTTTYPTNPTNPTNPGGNTNDYGSGMDPKKWAQYRDRILEMVGGINPADVGAAPTDLLSGLINSGVDSSKADSAAQYGGVADLTSNAYRDMQVMDAPQFDPQIAALLAAQGMGTDYATAAQMQGQSGLDDVNGLYQNQKNVLSGIQSQYNDARNSDVDELAANSAAGMESQRTSLLAQAQQRFQSENQQYEGAQLQAKYAAEQQKRDLLMSLLSSGLGNGMDLSGIDIAKLMGSFQ